MIWLALPGGLLGAAGVAIPVRVESLLQQLQRTGIEVIYSSALLKPEMLAPAALADGPPLKRAAAALAANGLELRQVGPHRYVVVVAPTPQPAAVVPAPVFDSPEEVSVYASRYAFEGGQVSDPLGLSAADIALVPGSNDDSLRALRTLPGLATNASARPYIRGSRTEDVLVRYDGITLLDPYHLKNFQSLISAVDPAAIGRIEVFSGGFPAQFGTRAGGVIDISAPERSSGYENRASLSLISGGVSSLGTSERWPIDWVAAFRHSLLDLLEPVENDFGKPRFSDSLGRLRWKTDDGAWTLGWLLLDDQLRLGSTKDEEFARARYRDEYAWLAREQRFGAGLRTRLTAVVTSAERARFGNLAQPGLASGEVRETQEFDRLEFNNLWIYEPDDTSALTFGAEAAVSRSENSYSRVSEYSAPVAAAFGRPVKDALVYQVRPKAATYALHVAQRHRWRRFEAELGVRMDGQDYNLGGAHLQVSPRFNVRYDLADRLNLYASAGRFTQAQHVEEWDLSEAQPRAQPAQLSVQSVLGLALETDSARWTVEAYTKRWSSIAPYFDNELDPLSLLPDLAPDRVRIVPHRSEASGLEVNIRAPLSDRLSAWSALSWSRVADELVGDDVLRSWDQPLAWSGGLAWKTSRASVSVLAGWHRGWPRTPVTLDASDESLAIGARNSRRWTDFLSLDLRGSWTWPMSRGELDITLDVTNASNRANPCCTAFENRPTSQFPTAETDHWLPLLANLGFAFRWAGAQ